MPDITVTVAPDGLKASITVAGTRAQAYPDVNELFETLRRNGVVHGIDHAALDRLAVMRICNRQVDVAQGTPPQPGTAGRIEVLIDVTGKGHPRHLQDGRVDHRDLSFVVNVEKGTLLARRIPPVPGRPGRNVIGHPVPPPPLGEVQFKVGTGTCEDPADPNILLAKITGGIAIDADGRIEVRDQKIVRSDIDYGTGNIGFTGDLYIIGSVRTGFAVEVTGCLSVSGVVEDVKIKCGGDCSIGGGAVSGGNGSIECGGTLKVRHLENFVVRAGKDVAVVEDVMQSTINAEGIVSAKSIIGGVVVAGDAVRAENIGSTAETRTVVDIGLRHNRREEHHELLRMLAAQAELFGSYNQEMFNLVREGMNEAGELLPKTLIALDTLGKRKVESTKTSRLIEERIKRLEQLDKGDVVPYIEAVRVFPNTLVKFGPSEKLIKENIENVRLCQDA